MSVPIRVLLVADPSVEAALGPPLERHGFVVACERAETADALRSALAAGSWDVALLASDTPGLEILAAVELVRAIDPDVPVVVVAGAIGEELAAGAIRSGASDVVSRSNLARLGPVVERELAAAIERRARRAAATAERRFRVLVEKSSEAVVVLDGTGQLVYGSPAAEKIGGRPASEFLGRHAGTWTHPDDLPAATWQFHEILERPGHSATLVSRYLHATGEWRWVEATHTNLLADPDVAAVIVNFRDVTERVRAEQERTRAADHLARTAQVLRAVADHVGDAVFVKDAAGRYLFFNEAAARFVGKSIEEVLGHDDTALFDPEGARRIMDRDRAVMVSGVTSTEDEVLTADGVTRVYRATKAPYRDASGAVVGLVGVSREVAVRGGQVGATARSRG